MVKKKATAKAKQKSSKVKKGAWFVKVRGSYLPASPQGWLTYIPFVAFLVAAMDWAARSTLPVGQIILILFPAWVASAVVMTWVASRKS